MLKLITTFKKNSTVSASVLLALMIILAYSPVIFLDQSYNRSTPLPPELLGYQGKTVFFSTTGDRWGDFHSIWPNIKLAAELISEGQIPLWNPYLGVGQPQAAESSYRIFSPLMIGFLLPTQFWDLPLLVTLWVAGIFTFLFLRSLGLNFVPSIAGGIFYMLSGGFTWLLPNPNTTVMMFTPFILYSLEKLIQHRNLKYIVLASIAFSFGILGEHLESIILQFLLVGLYLFYRILYPVVSNYRKPTQVSGQTILLTHDTKRIISWSALAFIGGLGLSAFFIFPVYEFIENNVLEHDNTTGSRYSDTLSLLTTFVPYALGQIHAYWFNVQPYVISSWGYVGIFTLFFSLLGIWFSSKNKGNPHRYTPLFFFAVSIFFIMKLVGVPVVSWIGHLPILDRLSFIHYLGVIIPFGFAVAAAFGIDMLTKLNVSKKTLGIIFIITISTILLLLIPLLPLLSDDAKFSPAVTPTDARNYVGFQILQAVIFAIFAFLLSIAISKNKSAILGIIPLVLLELSLYIPVGLHPVWMAFKAIIIIAGMAAITAVILRPNRLTWNLQTRNIKLYVIVGILIVTFTGIVMVSELSPFGMMKRYDSFQKDPVTDFLKENLGSSRMFSFDFTLGPNYPAAYKISTVGQYTAFNIDSFYSFNHYILKEKEGSRLGFYPWTYSYGPMGSIDKFFEHKKYFDFLGVKYILTEGYDFNTFAPGIPGQSGQYAKISDNNISQSFISPVDSIKSIGISLGASQLQKQDNIILTLDSVPPDERYHRESLLNQTINLHYNEFQITPPLTDVSDKEFYLSLKYPQADVNKLAVVFTISENQTGYDIIKNELHGKFYENGIAVDGKQMAFSITSGSNKYPVAFKFHDIYLYENTDAFPRAFLVNKFYVVDEDKTKNLMSALDVCINDHMSCLNNAQDFLMKNPDFDLRHEVILEEQLPDQESNLLGSSTGTAEVVSLTANKVIINTDSTDASLLVLTDSYYPGWKAHVDGKESKIYRADGLVRAIFVPAGSHVVEFSYLPESFVIGVTISVITVAILTGVFVYSKRKDACYVCNRN